MLVLFLLNMVSACFAKKYPEWERESGNIFIKYERLFSALLLTCTVTVIVGLVAWTALMFYGELTGKFDDEGSGGGDTYQFRRRRSSTPVFRQSVSVAKTIPPEDGLGRFDPEWRRRYRGRLIYK